MPKESGTPVLDVIMSRKSVRAFDDRPVEKEKLEICLEAARRAPSWANKQCWHFIVINGKEKVKAAGILKQPMKNLPAIIVACAEPNRSGNGNDQPYYMVDIGISVEHIVLTAWEQGLGACWVGWFDEEKVKDRLGIPDHIRVVALLPIGYPAEKEGVGSKIIRKIAGSGDRKPLEEFVHHDKW